MTHGSSRIPKLLLLTAAALVAVGLWVVSGERAGGTEPHALEDLYAGATAGPRDAGGADARPARGRVPGPPDGAGGPEMLPAPIERGPAPEGAPPLDDFGEVVVQRPAVRLDGVTAEDALALVLGHGEVRFATMVQRSSVVVTGADGQPHEVRIASVDPRGFRVLTPQVTADAQGLWQHLVDGSAVVDHETADRLGSQLGEELALSDRPPLRVGAIAALGSPSPADVVVSADTGQRLGLGGATSLLVSLREVARPSRVAADLSQLVGAEATPLIEDRVVELGVTNVSADQWDEVWDRLAWCESSGRWHLDSGNGYYGGLQFLPESWWWVGGRGMPHEASREEQIARAKILLAYQGWEAWPACSRALGYR